MAKRHSYYNKEISWSRQLFRKTNIARKSEYLKTTYRKLAMNLIVIFNSIIDIYFQKYVAKVFCISFYFEEKNWECFKVQLSVSVSLYILSSTGANQLEVLHIRTLGNIQGNSLHGILFYWSCDPQMYSHNSFFQEICRSFRTSSKKLVLENYVLVYHTADKDHANIF